MGTNYYATIQAGDRCTHCGRGSAEEELHVGKSSVGWRFTFQGYDATDSRGPLKTVAEWEVFLRSPNVALRDEYHQEIDVDDLLTLVRRKADGLAHDVYHGPDITGDRRFWESVQKDYWRDGDADFSARDFS